MVKVTLRNTSLEETCEKPLRCHDSKFRTIDGSCNNLQHGHWGRAETALQRIGMAAYADGKEQDGEITERNGKVQGETRDGRGRERGGRGTGNGSGNGKGTWDGADLEENGSRLKVKWEERDG